MLVESVEALVWFIRLVLLAGLAWGAWLCIDYSLLPARPQKTLALEHFATFALLVLLLSTLGVLLQAG
jgi:hypothetical protein